MCGRYALHGPKTRKQGDPLAFRGAAIDYAPHYNIPRAGPAGVLRRCRTDSDADALGFVPAWATPGKAPMNNARAETISETDFRETPSPALPGADGGF
jgi:putative SOS response-associated peptidase YedK